MRHRITIQENTTTTNAFLEVIEGWADLCTVWAAIEPLSGKRYFEAKQANTDETGMVRIRYRSGLDPKMRAKLGSRYLYFVAIINPDEKNRTLQISYREEV
jgi:SPP1 family predicted phage head-tail adaptor